MARLYGFLDFIREQGVIGFAVGFILGGAVSTVTKSLVADVINPIVGLFFNSIDSLSQWTIGVVRIGSFSAALIDFLILAAVVYFVFKGLKLDKLDKKK